MTRIEFGQWLRNIRKTEKLTMQDLAKACGCSIQYVAKIENGQLPSAKHACSISKVLGLDAEEVLNLRLQVINSEVERDHLEAIKNGQ